MAWYFIDHRKLELPWTITVFQMVYPKLYKPFCTIVDLKNKMVTYAQLGGKHKGAFHKLKSAVTEALVFSSETEKYFPSFVDTSQVRVVER